jgi:Protein of unknown function (DUF3800)
MRRQFSFVAYVDEYGDDGFKFPQYGTKGSSLWLSLSAAVFKVADESEQVKCIDRVNKRLGRRPEKALHFRDLTHEQKIVCSREVARAHFASVNVSIYKPNLTEQQTFSQRGLLYNYSSKFLLERVSWLCWTRYCNKSRPISGDGFANVIFSQRRTFDPEKFSEYLRKIRRIDDSKINWSVIDPAAISDAPHGDLRGLQVADVLASSLGAALVPHPTSQIPEHRYLKALWGRVYRHKGQVHTFGLKFYPSTMTEMGNAIPDDVLELLGLETVE